ncbi:MAG: methylenetetrahydrofolate reductase [Clostridia bacterium]|nr:methylenetetrahydrofolate reductase [NAD(P)H] [Clostridia bacterium]
MKIKDMFKKGKTVFSFEVFPPKTTSPVETIYQTLEPLSDLKPDFISVTYGAGGMGQKNHTAEIAAVIKHNYNIEPVAHLTCLSYSKEQILSMLEELKANDVENILALRGDRSPTVKPLGEFNYASELVSFIKRNGDFGISGACYPEGHIEASSTVDDIKNLRTKVMCGAEHLISQLFFDNSFFYDFLEKARIAGIDVPVQAGIMPVVNRRQIERMVTMCGASLPQKFTKMMQRYGDYPDAMFEAGIAYAIDQITDLLSHGVDGIHLYTMNNPEVAIRIYNSIGSLIRLNKQE